MARRTGLVLGLVAMAAAFVFGGRRRSVSIPGSGDCPRSSALPIEDYAARELQATCDPVAKPGVRHFRDFVLERFGGGDVGIVRSCASSSVSEHEEGRAWDWGIVQGADLGHGIAPRWPADVDGFIDWLFCTDVDGNEHANARRAGIMYLIYNRRIWRSYDKPGQPKGAWYPYSGADPHTTHVHISFSWAGARAETSLYDWIRGASGGPDLQS